MLVMYGRTELTHSSGPQVLQGPLAFQKSAMGIDFASRRLVMGADRHCSVKNDSTEGNIALAPL